MIAGSNYTEPPVITTESPVTIAPGNCLAFEVVKMFYLYKRCTTDLLCISAVFLFFQYTAHGVNGKNGKTVLYHVEEVAN